MPKNKIQFQKGLILNRFLELYGTEEQCRERLFKARWPDGYKCPKCGYTNYYVVSTRGLYQCCNCRYQCSITSDTIFACSKLPLRTWFLGIFFITQSKEGISALNLRRLLGISVNAAMKMKHKLQHVMKAVDDSLTIKGLVELDDVYWGGKKSGGKRGRGAPGKTPFLAAIARNEEGHPIHMRMTKVAALSSLNVHKWSLKHIHHESVVISDKYGPLRGASPNVAFHGAINSSEIYGNPDNKIFIWINTMIGNVKRAIHGTYHAVSPKHLPRYLGDFCFRFNHRFDMGAMVDSLIKYSASNTPVPQRILKFAEKEG